MSDTNGKKAKLVPTRFNEDEVKRIEAYMGATKERKMAAAVYKLALEGLEAHETKLHNTPATAPA